MLAKGIQRTFFALFLKKRLTIATEKGFLLLIRPWREKDVLSSYRGRLNQNRALSEKPFDELLPRLALSQRHITAHNSLFGFKRQ